MNKTQPIFLISQPRSGSTMLQAVLSNHPEVATMAEPWIQLLRLPLVVPEKISSKTDWRLVMEACTTSGSKIGEDLLRAADCQLVDLARTYYDRAADGKQYFLDKTPRYYYLMDRLFDDYPDALFIILERHPAAVVRSIQKTWHVEPDSNCMLYFSDDLLLAPEKIRSFLEAHGRDKRVYPIHYEDMVEDPEGSISTLFAWLGLEYDPLMLDYVGNRQYSGELGDPNAGRRARLVAKSLPRGDAFLGNDISKELSQFCQGLVRYHEQNGYSVPRKDYWLPGKATFQFDYFLRASGLGQQARPGLIHKARYHIKRWLRHFGTHGRHVLGGKSRAGRKS